MDEKQFKTLLATITETIDKKIEEKVNGRIDSLRKSFDGHKEEMKPIYEAYTSANNAGKFIVWTSKVMLAIGIIVGSTIAAIKFMK